MCSAFRVLNLDLVCYTTNFIASLAVAPMPIVRQWNLKEGDKLDWSWEARNSEM
jgi:hypothetical protein